jgi:hypothetical protein
MRTLALVLALAPLPTTATAYSLTVTEECWYKYDPSFRDWIDNFQGKVRHGYLTMKDALRLHRAAWPKAPRMDRKSMRGRPARCRGLAPFTSKTEFD